MHPPLLALDADSLFYDAYAIADKQYRGSGFQPLRAVGWSPVPEEISDEIIEKGVRKVQKRIAEMRSRFYNPEIRAGVGGEGNFRYDIFPEYKSRNKAEPKTILKDLAKISIDVAISEGWVIPAHGKEADDLVRMWSFEAKAEGRKFIVGHLDKDLDCIAGQHFNYRTNAIYDVTVEQAMHHYFTQIVVGDSTDSIPGAHQIGPKRAAERFAHCKTLEDYQEATVEAYMFAHPDDWYERLTLNGKLIHMWRWEGDLFSCDDWPVVQAFR